MLSVFPGFRWHGGSFPKDAGGKDCTDGEDKRNGINLSQNEEIIKRKTGANYAQANTEPCHSDVDSSHC